MPAAVPLSCDSKNRELQFKFFSQASAEDCAELSRIRSVFSVKANQKISFVRNGHPGFYYLHEGFAKITLRKSGDTEIIRITGPEDLLGFGRWHFSASEYGVTALSNITVSFFRLSDFNKLQKLSPYIANEIVRWMMNILVSQEERLFCLKNATAKGRVAGTLYILNKRFGDIIGGNNSKIAPPIDRKTLASLAGVAIEVLSRALKELEEEKLIQRNARTIKILNTSGLEKAMLA